MRLLDCYKYEQRYESTRELYSLFLKAELKNMYFSNSVAINKLLSEYDISLNRILSIPDSILVSGRYLIIDDTSIEGKILRLLEFGGDKIPSMRILTNINKRFNSLYVDKEKENAI